jgi:hypothetical protein
LGFPFPSRDLGKKELIKAVGELITMSEAFGGIDVVVGRVMKASRCGNVMQE